MTSMEGPCSHSSTCMLRARTLMHQYIYGMISCSKCTCSSVDLDEDALASWQPQSFPKCCCRSHSRVSSRQWCPLTVFDAKLHRKPARHEMCCPLYNFVCKHFFVPTKTHETYQFSWSSSSKYGILSLQLFNSSEASCKLQVLRYLDGFASICCATGQYITSFDEPSKFGSRPFACNASR